MTETRQGTVLVRTPEGIEFSLTLAGPVPRFLAWLVDSAVLATVYITLGRISLLVWAVGGELGAVIFVLGWFLAKSGYGIAMEWLWRGQTIGKRLLRLRVIDENGLRLQFSQVLFRNLLRVVDMLPVFYLVGGAAVFLSRKSQRLGDFAANTIVVHVPVSAAPDTDQVMAGADNSFRDHPHLCARLRDRVTPEEAGLALRALLRREELDPDARVEVFGLLAARFRGIQEFPAETVEGLSDEQYIRNVVDIVFRQK